MIPSAELVDGGQFTVRAENAAGEARSTADLVIRPKGAAPGKYYHVTKVRMKNCVFGSIHELNFMMLRRFYFRKRFPCV